MHRFLFLVVIILLVAPAACLLPAKRQCVCHSPQVADTSARPTDEPIVLPLTSQRDRLNDWDYVDGGDCELQASVRRLVADSQFLRLQVARDGVWQDRWVTPLANIRSVCRFHWHPHNPPDVLDGMELNMVEWVNRVGDRLNLQAIRASCALRLLDALEARVRQQGAAALSPDGTACAPAT